ncbi:MAG: hypothetical protein P8104_04785, partial [Gammaproteobacteria bacterium]
KCYFEQPFRVLTMNPLSASTKYVPPRLRHNAIPALVDAHSAKTSATSEPVISTCTNTDPISLKNIAWERLSNVKKSIDGTVGVYFLYFDNHLQSDLCLKLTPDPYNEHYCANLFQFMGLYTPESILLDRKSDCYTALCRALYERSEFYETTGLINRSNKMYDLLKKIESFAPSIDHVLIMTCVQGRSLDSVKKGDWSYEALNDDQFYVDFGKGLVADAFVLNSDRYYFLYAHNPGNFRLPYPKHNMRTSPLCFIDQSVDALRSKVPLLHQKTLMCKFNQLMDMSISNSNKRFPHRDLLSRYSEHQINQERIGEQKHIVIASHLRESEVSESEKAKREKIQDINFLDFSLSIDVLVDRLCDDLSTETRYEINDKQKSYIKKGIAEAFIAIGSDGVRDAITRLHAALPEHPLKTSIPVPLLLANQASVRTCVSDQNSRHLQITQAFHENQEKRTEFVSSI